MEVAPIALFHGIVASCPQTEWETMISNGIGGKGIVKCIEIGDGYWTSSHVDIDLQVKMACKALKEDPDFAGKKVNLVGLSQGGSIARALVQRCDGLDVHTLFTFGTPNAGLHAYLNYERDESVFAPLKNKFWGWVFSFRPVQWIHTPADNFRRYWDYEAWIKDTHFMPDLNNLRTVNPTYK